MGKDAPAWLATPVAAAVVSMALLGAALPAKSPAPPRPSAALPRAAHASAEPSEAQLPPVDPAWRRNGWHAVVPHGYVIRALVPARSRPDASAPAVFWLKGGVRVPILEQRAHWWRVGWTHARSGWLPAADLQPHASFILIDVRTGHVLRRLAAKGEQGPVSDGRFLWSFSDTGITRTALTDPPAIWSNPARRDPHGRLPDEGIWTPDRARFFVPASPEGKPGPLVEVAVGTGAVRQVSCPGNPSLVHANADGSLLLERSSSIYFWDARRSREIKRAPGDEVQAVAKHGSVYTFIGTLAEGGQLIRYDSGLRPLARAKVRFVGSACLSPDEHFLALSDEGGAQIDLRRADTLTRVMTLHPNRDDDGPFVTGFTGGAGGWWAVVGGDGGNPASVIHFTRQGRRVHIWDSDTPAAMSSDGRTICLVNRRGVLVLDTLRGATRQIPYSWRRPLPRPYLPKPSDPETPTRLEVSALTLTPDGRTLILTEWLNGDPET